MKCLFKNSELASVNFHSHFVVSGKPEPLKDIENFLQEKNMPYQSLPVTMGFHSALIEPAAPIYTDFLKQKTYQPPKISFISCVYADILTSLAQNYLWKVIRKPILFQQKYV
jgi:acyl transferase domain-containing protein